MEGTTVAEAPEKADVGLVPYKNKRGETVIHCPNCGASFTGMHLAGIVKCNGCGYERPKGGTQ